MHGLFWITLNITEKLVLLDLTLTAKAKLPNEGSSIFVLHWGGTFALSPEQMTIFNFSLQLTQVLHFSQCRFFLRSYHMTPWAPLGCLLDFSLLFLALTILRIPVKWFSIKPFNGDVSAVF